MSASVVEPALVTVTVKALAPARRLASPEYSAVSTVPPTGSERAGMVNVATPPESGTVPSVVPPFFSVAVPVAVPRGSR